MAIRSIVTTGFSVGLLSLGMGLTPAIATAQNFPGRIDEALVGDWDCEGVRTYITKWGSIELLADEYAAGLYDAADGFFAIKWDEGEREDWSYELDGIALIFTLPEGQERQCAIR